MDYKSEIAAILDAKGYAEIPDNKLPEASSSNFKDKGYSLKFTGLSGVNYLANDGMDYLNKYRLEIGYITQTPEQRAEKAADFILLFKDISKLPDFNSFTSDPSFDDYGDSTHCKGAIELLIGVECTC
jgi:hypothetical protein